MEFLFYGIEHNMIKEEINKIKTKYNIEPINVSYYDLNKDFIKEVIDDASTISLFDNKKMIICDNANIFTTTNNDIEQDTEILVNYLSNKSEATILIFIVNLDKVDERKKITKLINNKKEFNKVDINRIIKEKFIGYEISDDTILFFRKKVGNNTGIILNEIEKLINYKYDDKIITKKDIEELTSETIETDLFLLIDLIIKKDIEKSIKMYREMLNQNEEPIKIIITLANQFRLIYQVKEYYKEGLKESEIASKLKVHPYRVKLALEKSYSYSEDTILDLLHKLAILDYNIKSGKVEKQIAFELFILEV